MKSREERIAEILEEYDCATCKCHRSKSVDNGLWYWVTCLKCRIEKSEKRREAECVEVTA